MNVVDIFAVSDTEALWSVRWDVYPSDELNRVFDQLTDAEYLHGFFDEHKKDLFAGFYSDISIEEAVLRTRKEALALKSELLNLDSQGRTEHNEKLSQLFRPLSSREFSRSGFVRHKAYGTIEKSMIRLYAVELKPETYLVSGGTIKLTRKMQDRQHTNEELRKLNWTIEFLKSEGIYL